MRKLILLLLAALFAWATFTHSDSFSGDLSAWTQAHGTWEISAGKLTATVDSGSTNPGNVIYYSTVASDVEQYVQAKLWKDPTNNRATCLVMQYQAAPEHLILGQVRNITAGDDLWQIYYYSSGYTQIGSNFAEEFSDGGLVRLEFTPSTDTYSLKLWNGSSWVTKTSGVYAGYHAVAGYAGCRLPYTAGSFDDWESGNPLTPPASTRRKVSVIQ